MGFIQQEVAKLRIVLFVERKYFVRISLAILKLK